MLHKIVICNINTTVEESLSFIGYLTMANFWRNHKPCFLQVGICLAES